MLESETVRNGRQRSETAILRPRVKLTLSQTARWDCFEDALASLIGYYEVAQETWVKLHPSKQSHSTIQRKIDPG